MLWFFLSLSKTTNCSGLPQVLCTHKVTSTITVPKRENDDSTYEKKSSEKAYVKDVWAKDYQTLYHIIIFIIINIIKNFNINFNTTIITTIISIINYINNIIIINIMLSVEARDIS